MTANPAENKALQIFLFWTVGDSPLSRLIKRVSNPTHAGLGWSCEDGTMEYADALFGKGFRAGKPMANLDEWLAAGKASKFRIDGNFHGNLKYAPWIATGTDRQLIIRWTKIYADDAEKIRQRALALDGQAAYYEWQLLQMWAFERLGLPVRRSPRKVVCSEIQARLVKDHYDFRTIGRPTFDHLRPQDTFEGFERLSKLSQHEEAYL